MGPETIDISLDAGDGIGSSTFYISFTFSGYSFNINYWYIDDVILQEYGFVPEYNEDICTVVLDPGQSADLTFPDWTPNDLQYGINGPIDYKVIATANDLDDTNPANDQATEDFTLDYYHDIGVQEITQPSGDGDRAGEWIHYDTGVYSNAFGSTTNEIWGAVRFTPTELGPYDGWKLSKIKWKNYAPSQVVGEVIVYDSGTSTAPGPILTTEPIDVTGDIWYEFTLSNPVTIDASEDIWLCIHVTHAPSEYPIECSSPGYLGKSFWFSSDGTGWLDVVGYGYDVSAMIRGFVEEAVGPVSPDVYVRPETNPIEAIVENIGVFDETGLTCYAELYEFITDPLNGTLVYEDNEPGIDLDPLGGEETVTFTSYDFGIEGQGLYNLIIDFPLGDDLYPDNNQEVLGIGCDDTEPTSTHTLDPPIPDGENGWYVSDVTVTLDAEDGTQIWQSGVKEIKYRINGGTIQTITGSHGSFTITEDGDDIEVEYWAIDNVDNEESPHNTFTIDMDQTAPIVDLTYEVTGGNSMQGWDITWTATATDDTSGMDRVEFFLNNVLQETVTGPGPTFQWMITYYPLPQVYFKATGYDIAGNFASDVIENPKSYSKNTNQQTIKTNQVVVRIR
jgi:hypothetical protein